MEKTIVLQQWLSDELVLVKVDVDESPELCYQFEFLGVAHWLEEKDVNLMIRLLQAAKRERKEMVDD